MASSFLNVAGTIGRVTINERIKADRRQRQVLARVSRAAWRLEQAERERTWALAPCNHAQPGRKQSNGEQPASTPQFTESQPASPGL